MDRSTLLLLLLHICALVLNIVGIGETQPQQPVDRNDVQNRSYSSKFLKMVKEKVLHSRTLRTIDPNEMVKIKECGIQKKRRRGIRAGKQCREKTRSRDQRLNECRYANVENLMHFDATSLDHRHVKTNCNLLRFLTANVRSIKNKDHVLRDYLLERNIDFCCITETWIQNNIEGECWVDCSDINNNGFIFLSQPRLEGRGGGVGLIVKDNCKASKCETLATKSFEHGLWRVQAPDITFHIIGIYRPPQTSIPEFCLEFADLMARVQDKPNLLITGDFNIHMDDPNNAEAWLFKNDLDALGLNQIVNFPTHKDGHILDLVIKEEVSKFKINKCEPGAIISDHISVICELNVPKKNVEIKERKSRNLKKINTELFNADLQSTEEEIIQNNNLHEIVNIFESNCKRTLDKHAPERIKKQCERKKEIWFMDKVNEQKITVRNAEKRYIKYRQDHQFRTFKME